MRFPFTQIGYALLGAVIAPIALAPLLLAVFMYIDIDGFIGIFILMYAIPTLAVVGAVAAVILRSKHQRSESSEWDRLKRWFQITFAGLVVITVAVYLAIPDRTHGPDDQAMIANFNQHRALFAQLSRMVDRDKTLQAVYDDHTWPKDAPPAGAPPARINDYRNLLHQIGAKNGLMIQDDRKEFQLQSWSYGQGHMFAPMYYKGYAWLATAPQNTVTKSLNQMQPEQGGSESVTYYRHIDANWYLFYQYEGD